MELWIRSTARTNLAKVNCLTIMEGNNFYRKNEWEYEGYVIADAHQNKEYVLLGTYKTKERALEVLDEIQENIVKQGQVIILTDERGIPNGSKFFSYVYEMPID